MVKGDGDGEATTFEEATRSRRAARRGSHG